MLFPFAEGEDSIDVVFVAVVDEVLEMMPMRILRDIEPAASISLNACPRRAASRLRAGDLEPVHPFINSFAVYAGEDF